MNEVTLNLLVTLALLVAAAGIVVPVLPGTLLALGAFLVWALVTGGAGAWGAFAVLALILGVGQVFKYLLPHRSMTAAGIPGRSIVVGGVCAVPGYFLIPMVGLVVGFVGGIFVAERLRLGDLRAARSSTWLAMKVTGFSMLIELAALMLAATVWAGAAVLLTTG